MKKHSCNQKQKLHPELLNKSEVWHGKMLVQVNMFCKKCGESSIYFSKDEIPEKMKLRQLLFKKSGNVDLCFDCDPIQK